MSKTLAWIEVVAGLWLIVAPFILKYSATAGAMWNDIVLGVIVGVVGLIAAFGKGTSAPAS